MATDRSVNININYRVNSVEIEKGEAAVKRADQATEQLRKATENFNNKSSQGFKSTSKTIEGMEIELARLRQLIKLTSVEDTARLNKLSGQYKALKTQVDSYNKSLLETAKATKSASRDTDSLAKTFGEVYAAVRLFIAAGIVREVVAMNLQMAKLSGNVEGVERAFSRLPNSELLLRSLREATHGTVNDLQLMQRALMANNFRIPLQDLGTLLEFAAVKAQQTGQEVNHLVDYIISGIGYRSIKRLDDLGFTANRVKEALGGVSLQAASMQQVMSAVTRLMNEDLEKTGGYAETTATGVGVLETAIHELNVEVSNQVANSRFIQFLTDATNALRIFAKSGFNLPGSLGFNVNTPIVLFTEEVARQAEAQAAAFEKSNKALKEQERILDTDKELYNLAQTIKLYKEQEETGTTRIEMLKAEVAELTEKNKSFFGLQKLSTEEAKLIEQKNKEIVSIEKSNTALGNNRAVLAEVIKLIVDYRKALTTIPDTDISEEDDGKRALPPVLKQVVDLDLKDPITGEIKKFDRDTVIKTFTDMASAIKGAIPEYQLTVTPFIPMDAWDRIAVEFSERWRDIVSSGIMDVTDVINSYVQAEADSYQTRLNNLQKFYDEQLSMAEQTEKGKTAFEIETQRKRLELEVERDREEQKLRAKAFEAEKEAKRLQTIINGSAGIINAFATLPYPAAIVASIQIAGQTAAQLAVINRQQYRGFKDGVIDLQGPGTSKSDSIPSMLSRGESVMTAEETAASKSTLKAIRAKKLNDRVLKDIVSGSSGGSVNNVFDDSKLLRKLDEVKDAQPDIVQRGNLIYETRKKSDTYKQWVRSKSMG